jgi:large subunit ribosomal protein L39e
LARLRRLALFLSWRRTPRSLGYEIVNDSTTTPSTSTTPSSSHDAGTHAPSRRRDNVARIILTSSQSHKTFRTKQKLAKAQKQNRPIPQWIRLRTNNTIRYARCLCLHIRLCVDRETDSATPMHTRLTAIPQVQRQATTLAQDPSRYLDDSSPHPSSRSPMSPYPSSRQIPHERATTENMCDTAAVYGARRTFT